jgi:hypothetical protein
MLLSLFRTTYLEHIPVLPPKLTSPENCISASASLHLDFYPILLILLRRLRRRAHSAFHILLFLIGIETQSFMD